VDLVNDLIREGAYVTAYDPKGNIKIKELNLCPGVHLADTALEAVQDAEALVLATEWPDFAAIDMEQVLRMMHTPIVFDGRNLFNPMTMRDLGFQYYSIGRPSAKLIVDELPNRLVSRRDNNESTATKLQPLARKA
jgi:UDPglucose 6-dehydrogenase